MFGRHTSIPHPQEALSGRAAQVVVATTHFVNGRRLDPPFPAGLERALFGLGCFWGAERKYWQTGGVYSTAVGYAGGSTPNPTYEEVCSGMTILLCRGLPSAIPGEESTGLLRPWRHRGKLSSWAREVG